MAASEDFVGKRVHVGRFIGTVWYHGEVSPKPGLWLGVDWDDPTRGKNDGSIDGVRYFFARTPISGSFIRASICDFGVSFLTALRSKYESVKYDSSQGVDINNLSELKRDLHVSLVEVVGFDKVIEKQSRLEKLQVVILEDQRISSSDSKEEIRRICPSIKELDLKRNLISDWKVIAEISSALPNLKILNLSENRVPVHLNILGLSDSFLNLTHLVLARMEYEWVDVEPLLRIIQNLEYLQVPLNNISEIYLLRTPLKLRSLDLSGNPIKDWNEIIKLGQIPCLEELNCSGTQIDRIRFPGNSNLPTVYFQSLKTLYLQESLINEFRSIDELNRPGKLEVLKFTQRPLSNEYSIETIRQMVIAKISTLKILNGEIIDVIERKASEMDYMRAALVEKISYSIPDKEFNTLHPRYSSLVKTYGVAEFESLGFESKPPLSQTLIDINIVCPARPDMKINRKFPKTMTVKRFCNVINRIVRLDPDLIQLYVVNDSDPTVKMILSNDSATLDYYNVKSGDTIVAREVSPQ